MTIRTVFLDRDGVLNADSAEYILRPQDVRILPGVPEALRRLTDAGIRSIIISNQSAVGRGLMSRRAAEDIFQMVIHAAESAGGKITDHYYCPHTKEDACSCRKPGTRLFGKAAEDHAFPIAESAFIGDGFGDAGAAAKLGIPFYLVQQGWWEKARAFCEKNKVPYTLVPHLGAAVDDILHQTREERS